MVISIHVKPNSKIDDIGYDEYGNLKVKIRAQPVDGKANKYLEAYLSEVFKVPKSSVLILKGTGNQHKKVEILGDEMKLNQILVSLKRA